MDKQQTLHQIVKTRDLKLLGEFEGKDVWGSLEDKERRLLGTLFLWRACDQLHNNEQQAIESVRLAEKIAPDSADVSYWQGIFWLRYANQLDKVRGLQMARDKATIAVGLDPELFDAWRILGVALMRLGSAFGELDRFHEAEEKFSRAASLLTEEQTREKRELYWSWGICWMLSGKASGEAYDYRMALQKFEQVEKLGPEEGSFWLDYGKALALLGELTGEDDLEKRILTCYHYATQDPDIASKAWLEKGKLHFEQFRATDHPDHLAKARAAFQTLLDIDPENAEGLLATVKLLFLLGERNHRVEDIEIGLDLTCRAESCEGSPLEIGIAQIRGMVLLGVLGDRIDALREAVALSGRLVEQIGDDPQLLTLHGESLVALGRYFGDATYYKRAIDSFEQALAFAETSVDAHVGLARACMELDGEEPARSLGRRAANHLARAAELDVNRGAIWNQWGLVMMRSAQLNDDREEAASAVAKFSHAVALRKNHGVLPPLEWMFNLGTSMDFLGTYGEDEALHREAIEWLLEVNKHAPEDVMVHFHLGVAWIHLGEVVADLDCFRKGIDHLRHVAEVDPDEDRIWDEWGCALLMMAHLMDDPAFPDEVNQCRAEAEQRLLRAASLGSGEALYHLAWLYTQTEQYSLAVQCLKRAASKGALPPTEVVMQDDWLTELRKTDDFREFLGEL